LCIDELKTNQYAGGLFTFQSLSIYSAPAAVFVFGRDAKHLYIKRNIRRSAGFISFQN